MSSTRISKPDRNAGKLFRISASGRMPIIPASLRVSVHNSLALVFASGDCPQNFLFLLIADSSVPISVRIGFNSLASACSGSPVSS
ncbi:hypothetical protein A3C52_05120 [Candidatus Peribacteria bacterium RIFCSPHIGHO2_02_FULL_51_15]|nr:MAG: hypothetical protein A3C52_05120 [Candidatus Peribacteria bacterium RIFCSPHIGHO2_02_FULL_51_15]